MKKLGSMRKWAMAIVAIIGVLAIFLLFLLSNNSRLCLYEQGSIMFEDEECLEKNVSQFLLPNDFTTSFRLSHDEMCKSILYTFGQPFGELPKNLPETIPGHLKKAFLLDGKISEKSFFLDSRTYDGDPFVYTEEKINDLIKIAKRKGWEHSYSDLSEAFWKFFDKSKVSSRIEGSMLPWFESLAIAHGAKTVTTVDYQKREFPHPQIKFYKIEDYSNLPYDKMTGFDFSISFSSIEHSGLGRYGDPIDPFADVASMLRLKCQLKVGGILLLQVPSDDTKDTIEWNAHRIYGPSRTDLILRGWKILSQNHDKYRLYLLENLELDPYLYMFADTYARGLKGKYERKNCHNND